MELRDFGAIKSITVPGDWLADGEINTGVLKMICLHPPAHIDVEITLFEKTQGVSESALRDFRKILALGEHKVVESGEELLQLAPVMGNAGNNQWTNKERGARGPNFRFTQGEITNINGKCLLKVKGSFLEPLSKQVQNEYCGIFIDSGADNNRIQEIYLQVPASYGYFQFERFVKTFTDTLSTVLWK